MPPKRHRSKRTKRARDALVLENVGVAFAAARKLYYKWDFIKRIGALQDIEQEALLILVRAAELWDKKKLTKGKPVKFDTYATAAITNHLVGKAPSEGLIHIPRHVPAKIRILLSVWDVLPLPVQRRGEVPPSRLCAKEVDLDAILDKVAKVSQIREALGTLCPLHRTIIELRYALHPETVPMTYKAIGMLVNRSRQRVSQLEQYALRKIREALNGDPS